MGQSDKNKLLKIIVKRKETRILFKLDRGHHDIKNTTSKTFEKS